MTLGIVGALALALAFPFAAATLPPERSVPSSPVDRALLQLDQPMLIMGGEPDTELDPSSLRLLEVDDHGISYFAGFALDGTPAGVILPARSDEPPGMGFGQLDSREFGFASGSDSTMAYLALEVAPSEELGFRYCARSTVEPMESDDWMIDAMTFCESAK